MYERACDAEDPDPTQPVEVTIRCRNCMNRVHEGEVDESMQFIWKTLTNYPADRTCPDCGEELHSHPMEKETYCRGNNDVESHGRFCCDCGMWMIKAQNADLGGWECPNDTCSCQRLG